MKLGTKIATATSLAFAAVLAAATVALVFDEIAFLEEEMDVHGRLLGHVVASAVGETWAERGETAARELVEEIDRQEERIQIRWLEMDASRPPGDFAPLTREVLRQLRQGKTVGRLSSPDEETLYTFVPVPSSRPQRTRTKQALRRSASQYRRNSEVDRSRPERAGDEAPFVDGNVPREEKDVRRVIGIAESLEMRSAHVRTLLTRIATGAAAGVLLSALVAYLLGKRYVGRPVGELTTAARQVGAGDFSHRTAERRHDELGSLAREMNEMASNLDRAWEIAREEEIARREVEQKLQHAARLATLGQLASGVAHEMGTPLQSITMRADMISQEAGHLGGVQRSVEGIKKQSDRLATIVRNLLRFARKQSPNRAPHDVARVIESTLTLVETAKAKATAPIDIVTRLGGAQPGGNARATTRPSAGDESANVEEQNELPNGSVAKSQEEDSDATVLRREGDGQPTEAIFDEEQVEQVLLNLVINAMQAMPQGGTITVGLEEAQAEPPPDLEAPAEQYLCLYVEDEGTGIPDEVLPHLFEPFFTTKGVGEGTGLGLSISYGIIREHGGWIDVKTSPGKGSRFCVYLPAAQETTWEQRAKESEGSF